MQTTFTCSCLTVDLCCLTAYLIFIAVFGIVGLMSHVSWSDFCSLLVGKGKGIWFIVLYPPKRSHDLPPLAGTVHTGTISIPQGIFQSNWQHIAHTL